MTYCAGIIAKKGGVLGSDSRTNSGADMLNVCRKMHPFVKEGAARAKGWPDELTILATGASARITRDLKAIRSQ